jgi:predicted flap endonuclease-1-like 5' DNA nuclease
MGGRWAASPRQVQSNRAPPSRQTPRPRPARAPRLVPGASRASKPAASTDGDRHVANDLADLEGIGPRKAEMLKNIGVDSIKELRHRNPANVKKMIEERHGRVVGLSGDECRTWIEEAKTHQA